MKFALLTFDHQLFTTINHLPHTVFSDSFALFLSGIGSYGFIWIAIAVLLFIREERRDHLFFLPVVISTFVSWLLVLVVLKPYVARLRPLKRFGAIVVETGRMDYSFPSFHATIAWALAVVLAQKEPKLGWLFYLLALLISLSRIYLGVHYPVDVFVGSIIGIFIGYVSVRIEDSLSRV